MDKQEILKRIIDTRQVNNFQRTKEWEDAFEAYKKANPNDGKHLSFNCGSCYNRVMKWLWV